jgi:Fe-S oxidoreductase
MTEAILDTGKDRLAAKPVVRYDRQGTAADAERVQAAVRAFVKDLYSDSALWLDSCIHCGWCAEACHFYVQTGNPKYTPIHKLELFSRTYRREVGPFRWLYKLFGKEITADELEQWQDLIYDSCTVCGRCSMICPMGIDIAGMVGQARHAMVAAGMVPHELWSVTQRAWTEGSPLGASPEVFEDRIEWMADEHEVEIPVDKEKAEVIITISSIEIMKYPKTIADFAKIMNYLGADWTFRTDGYEATNFGQLSGDTAIQRDLSMKLVNAALATGAKTLILPECGHAYVAMRWQAANFYGKPLPFEVLHIAEYLARALREGKLKLKRVDTSATFHDPCQIVRRGGTYDEHRELIRALGIELREMEHAGWTNWCCGGGGGVVSIHRADPLRYRTFKIKMDQVEQTGADLLLMSCSNCRLTFDDGQAHFHWDKTAQSLLELVADNLVEQEEA